MSKTIKCVAITAHTDNANGQEKVRFNADLVGFMKRYGKTAIRCDAIELPEATTDKVVAIQFAKNQAMFASASDQALLDEELAKREGKAAKAEKRVILTGGKTVKAKAKVSAEAVTE
jgi:hypothetical protein